jgi:proteasome accessory factor C
MTGHEKIVRTLRILLKLSNGRWYSRSELAEDLEHVERTIDRYIADIREVGFSVICKDGLYSIPKLNSKLKAMQEMLYFTEAEAHILNKVIHALDDNNVLKEGIVSKLSELYHIENHVEISDHPVHSFNIENISKAIKQKKQVVLKQYRSSNGQIVRDRLLEVFEFTTDYNTLWAFDPESRKCKVFKTARIGSVEILEKPYEFEEYHSKTFTDVFRMTGETPQTVRLKMTLLAYNLLIEEYPEAKAYTKELKKNYWQFEAPIANFAGVARFCMGLCEHIEIQRPQELKEYIKEKIKITYKL